MNYNLRNLSSLEFEMLCQDIFTKMLEKKLMRFKSGKDGGVDLCDEEQETIIQCKHYINSKYSNLKSVVTEEYKNNKELFEKDYYLITSLGLSLANKIKLFTITENKVNIGKILGEQDINSFLDVPENKSVIIKNHKLWFTSTLVLNNMFNKLISNDSHVLLSDIKEKRKFFVDTAVYYKCLKCLTTNNILLITGEPGSGKSVTSMMLVLYHDIEDYTIKYSSGNNIEKLLESIDFNDDKKELFYIDDFLGQHYIDLNSDKVNSITSLIKAIKISKNKKIIFNSRVTILNEAKFKNIEFEHQIDSDFIKNITINLDEINNVDKAKILYNLLVCCKVGQEIFDYIKKEKNYKNIINHKNYNPRILEKIIKYTKKNRDIIPEKFYSNIIKGLNYPEDVWKDEFETRLENIDRIIMNLLYTLTDTTIDKNILKKCFENYVSIYDIDTTKDIFNNSIKRLNNSLVKIVIINEQEQIGVLNPSINDYLRQTLKTNKMERKKLKSSAIYSEQVFKLAKIDIDIFDKVDDLYIKEEITKKDIDFEILKLIIESELKHDMFKEFVKNQFENYGKLLLQGGNFDLKRGSIIEKFVLNEGYRKYYHLEDIFFNISAMKKIVTKNHYSILDIIDQYNECIDEDNLVAKNEIKETFKDEYIWAIKEKISDDLRYCVDDIYPEFLDDFNYDEEGNIINIPSDISDEIKGIIKDKVKSEIESTELNQFPKFDYLKDLVEIDDILQNILYTDDYIIDDYYLSNKKEENEPEIEYDEEAVFKQGYFEMED